MEVCGGHTMSIHKFGIPSLLPKNIQLLSGPGCPVCVTSKDFIDDVIYCSNIDDVIIVTLGDLVRVPGSFSSLAKEKSKGHDIRIVYSVLEALEIAKDEQEKKSKKKIIFPGIGFETTAPLTAAAILQASKIQLNNFFVLSAHKVMPPVMSKLIDEGVKINGYICPGHVSVITGTKIYEPIVNNYGLACVVSGFEPLDILQSIYMLVKQIIDKNPKLENQYKRAVKEEGNLKAQKMMADVFTPRDDEWRGIGSILKSGLALQDTYKKFDARKEIDFSQKATLANANHPPNDIKRNLEEKSCICSEILKGLKKPSHCKLFGKVCTPVDPVGACMVSSEGACAAWYKYSRHTNKNNSMKVANV